jgi:hypothetical protein
MNRSGHRLVAIAEEINAGSPMQTRCSSINRLATAMLLGTGAALLIGSPSVKTYDWRTECFIPASLPSSTKP